jgi:hypothetical protein
MPLGDSASSASGVSGDIFYKAPRLCERRDVVPGHPRTVEKPERVKWGHDDVYEWHRCPDGQWGRLTLLNPPNPGAVPSGADPMIVTATPLSELEDL